jgi:RHS repeat-associated protein
MVSVDEKSIPSSETIRRRTQPMVNNMYQGMSLDPVTGLYYERNRNYSPTLDRWLTGDPLRYINGANTYQFVGSDPVGMVYPTGLSWWDWMFQPGTSYGYMGMGGTIRRNPLPPPTPQSGWLGALDNFQAWINGHRGTTYYPPGSPDSRQMSQSTVGEALVRYFLLVKNPGNPPCEKWRGVSDFSGKFGLTDVFENLGNGTAEFVGSARGDASILRVHCSGTSGSVTVKFKLTNVTSLTSFLYHFWPNGWNVTTPGRPFSNWTQIYEWTRTFNCRCCNPRGDIGR